MGTGAQLRAPGEWLPALGSLLTPPQMARRILELNPLGHCQYCLQGPTQIFKSGGVGGCGLWAGTTQHTLDRGGLRTQAPPGHLRSDRKHVSLFCEVGSQVKGPRRPSPSPSRPQASTSMSRAGSETQMPDVCTVGRRQELWQAGDQARPMAVPGPDRG